MSLFVGANTQSAGNQLQMLHSRPKSSIVGTPETTRAKYTPFGEWLAVLIDADGTITMSLKNDRPQLSVRVTNKLLVDVSYFQDIFGGAIYFDSSQNGYYSWSIQSINDVLLHLNYFIANCHSRKSNRFHLIEDYFYLRDLEAFRPDSPHYGTWLAFMSKWEHRGDLRVGNTFMKLMKLLATC